MKPLATNLSASRRSLGYALLRAARAGDATAVSALIELKAPLGWRDTEGRGPLHHACGSISIDEARSRWGKAPPDGTAAIPVLLAAGASVDARDGSGCTPLHCAATAGRAEACALLLAAGADPNARNNAGETPLHLFLSRGSWANSEAGVFLLAGGADPNAVARGGAAPLHACATNPKGILPLVEAGADPNARDRNGRTPLHAAVEANHSAAVAFLFSAGADLAPLDAKGRLPEVLGTGKAANLAKILREGAELDEAMAPARPAKPALGL